MNIEYFQKDLNFSLTIDNSLLQEIHNHVKKHYPKEFGGILIGSYSSCGKKATVTEVSIPSKYSNSQVLFTRFVDDLNKKLSDLYKKSNGKIIYLGEWHSHPNGSSAYSATDFNSISEISKNTDVKISSPIMLILSAYKNSITEKIYIYHNEKIHTYEKNN